jgi:metal-dependent hydrolase (beta-lactamase superfamily II)
MGLISWGSLLRLKMIMPGHCTVRKRKIAALYPEQTVRCGAGEVIEL